MAQAHEKPREPLLQQDAKEISTLEHNLNQHTSKQSRHGKKDFSCKKTSFPVAGSPGDLTVDSWRFQDWDYKRDDLPTYARGLFFSKNETGQPEIVVRGYDKFFNIGEVKTTEWKEIENNTKGPYELSLKENGCIIFISGLHDGTLLVTSKHSTGGRADALLSHALAGEKWVDRQLKHIGCTRQDLAWELRRRNATAVAELCDDDFEEHILAYAKDAAGLYLHGINVNIPEFTTYSGAEVQTFADKWNFKRTQFLVIDDLVATRAFLESVAETGSYNGRDVEGFVIRCQSKHFSSGPYQDWFFKYKFEEPYLMYRQWRECTKALISGKTPKYKKHAKVTEDYLLYVRRRFALDPDLAKEYNHNHGIIALRNDFLKEINMKGSDIIRQECATTENDPLTVVLVPIATIGCGKTTIAVALHQLFGWGHVQNDNITGKARPPRFTKEVVTQLEDTTVVVADRNNAQRHERKQIIQDLRQQQLGVQVVALNFIHTQATINQIRKVTQDRVLLRGDNHQTIQAATDSEKVKGIMEGFITRFEPVDPSRDPDDAFDTIIDLDPVVGSRQNLEIIVSSLFEQYPQLFGDMPSSEDLDEAINIALHEYKPDLKHDLSQRGPQLRQTKQQTKKVVPAPKSRPLEYFSVQMPHDRILGVLADVFATKSGHEAELFQLLQQKKRVQSEFHVTLMHRAQTKEQPELWERYRALHNEVGGADNKLGPCEVLLERIVWDDRIMAIVVRVLDVCWDSSNSVPHITIGTKAPDVKPKESNDLLQKWLESGSGTGNRIQEAAIKGRIVVQGFVGGVLASR